LRNDTNVLLVAVFVAKAVEVVPICGGPGVLLAYCAIATATDQSPKFLFPSNFDPGAAHSTRNDAQGGRSHPAKGELVKPSYYLERLKKSPLRHLHRESNHKEIEPPVAGRSPTRRAGAHCDVPQIISGKLEDLRSRERRRVASPMLLLGKPRMRAVARFQRFESCHKSLAVGGEIGSLPQMGSQPTGILFENFEGYFGAARQISFGQQEDVC
jgi:hypothetical protein